MKIGILRFGQLDSSIIDRIIDSIETSLASTEIILIAEPLPTPEEALSETRKQYRSDIILNSIRDYAARNESFDCILGIVDVDLFVPRLNFVFGEADSPGKAAVISLWRLRPEFYGQRGNSQVFAERGTTEAVHELGHTLGLKHCPNPFCVMYFSNSIFETDRKQSLFCNKCYLKARMMVDKGKTLEGSV